MVSYNAAEKRLTKIIESIEIPENLYEKAKSRYESLSNWIDESSPELKKHEPDIFPQGSFRLGTAIYPINRNDDYDVDLGIKLRKGLTKDDITQFDLKELVKVELNRYRKSQNIKSKLDEKRRCWELRYLDNVAFHMDIVPGVPDSEKIRMQARNEMIEVSALSESLADEISSYAMAITDNERATYKRISDEWEPSNPQGYAEWFDNRVKQGKSYLNNRAMLLEEASIEDIPSYRWNSPLQQVIKILKRHRDVMYSDPIDSDSKPISIIISTLAAKAYNGEGTVREALIAILNKMETLVSKNKPHVPNPVYPSEDFADKWYSSNHAHLRLKENFFHWLKSAKNDLLNLLKITDRDTFNESLTRKLDTNISKSDEVVMGFDSQSSVPTTTVSKNSAPAHNIKI